MTTTEYLVSPPCKDRSKHFTEVFEASAVILVREMGVKRAGEILRQYESRM